jgi:SAM-dependent methyltransferase
MTKDDTETEDIPSPIDLRDPRDAIAWAAAADVKRPWRRELRRLIAEVLRDQLPPPLRVLELGPGPGLLALEILGTCAVQSLTLFDFSPPFLEMCRNRLDERAAVRLVLGDFTRADWPSMLDPPFDAVVSMQAVHEVRHKRHVPALHRRARSLLRPGGLCVVCDHVPSVDDPRSVALMSSEAEQRRSLELAGLVHITTHHMLGGLYVCSGTSPS